MACKTCRDRKVRCDGGQPSCQKCDRAGHTCVYVPATKYSKADLIDAVQSLSERLGEYFWPLILDAAAASSWVASSKALVLTLPIRSDRSTARSSQKPSTAEPGVSKRI